METEMLFQLDGTEQLVIRTGDAPKLNEPVKFSFAGLIDAPALYYVKRHASDAKYFKPAESVVMVDFDKRTIELRRNVHDQLGDVITGTIFGESQLVQFKINNGETMRPAELAKLLKRNKMYFDSETVANEIVAALTHLKVETTGEIVVENDQRGNKTQSFQQRAVSKIPESFVLKMPIFSNGEPVAFKVNIEFDIQGQTVLCNLESDDLYQFTVQGIRSQMSEQLNTFSESGIPIVYK